MNTHHCEPDLADGISAGNDIFGADIDLLPSARTPTLPSQFWIMRILSNVCEWVVPLENHSRFYFYSRVHGLVLLLWHSAIKATISAMVIR